MIFTSLFLVIFAWVWFVLCPHLKCFPSLCNSKLTLKAECERKHSCKSVFGAESSLSFMNCSLSDHPLGGAVPRHGECDVISPVNIHSLNSLSSSPPWFSVMVLSFNFPRFFASAALLLSLFYRWVNSEVCLLSAASWLEFGSQRLYILYSR